MRVEEPRTGDEDAFVAFVDEALDDIPPVFRERLASVAIVIEDEPTADQLAAVRSRSLFGLYQGVPRTAYGADHAQLPSKITIFRRPLERTYRDVDRLRDAVRDTVWHEVAHHLGIDDARISELVSERHRARTR